MRKAANIGLALLLLYTMQARSAPSSLVAWTPEMRKAVAAGDPAKGKELAQPCAACHGSEGVSANPAWPSLAGQIAAYLFKQLKDYQDGKRHNPLMSPLAAGLSEQAMADLSAYYAGLPPPIAKASERDLERVRRLAKHGDSKRFIPACGSCHGSGGEGNTIDIPRIASQNTEYFMQTLQAYKSGSRSNDVYERMRLLAGQLSDEEISLLAEYYAAVGRSAE